MQYIITDRKDSFKYRREQFEKLFLQNTFIYQFFNRSLFFSCIESKLPIFAAFFSRPQRFENLQKCIPRQSPKSILKKFFQNHFYILEYHSDNLHIIYMPSALIFSLFSLGMLHWLSKRSSRRYFDRLWNRHYQQRLDHLPVSFYPTQHRGFQISKGFGFKIIVGPKLRNCFLHCSTGDYEKYLKYLFNYNITYSIVSFSIVDHEPGLKNRTLLNSFTEL